MNMPQPKTSLGTYEMNAEEVVIMAQVLKSEGDSNEEILIQIKAFDDMLAIKRQAWLSLILQRRSLSKRSRLSNEMASLLEGRIERLVSEFKQI